MTSQASALKQQQQLNEWLRREAGRSYSHKSATGSADDWKADGRRLYPDHKADRTSLSYDLKHAPPKPRKPAKEYTLEEFQKRYGGVRQASDSARPSAATRGPGPDRSSWITVSTRQPTDKGLVSASLPVPLAAGSLLCPRLIWGGHGSHADAQYEWIWQPHPGGPQRVLGWEPTQRLRREHVGGCLTLRVHARGSDRLVLFVPDPILPAAPPPTDRPRARKRQAPEYPQVVPLAPAAPAEQVAAGTQTSGDFDPDPIGVGIAGDLEVGGELEAVLPAGYHDLPPGSDLQWYRLRARDSDSGGARIPHAAGRARFTLQPSEAGHRIKVVFAAGAGHDKVYFVTSEPLPGDAGDHSDRSSERSSAARPRFASIGSSLADEVDVGRRPRLKFDMASVISAESSEGSRATTPSPVIREPSRFGRQVSTASVPGALQRRMSTAKSMRRFASAAGLRAQSFILPRGDTLGMASAMDDVQLTGYPAAGHLLELVGAIQEAAPKWWRISDMGRLLVAEGSFVYPLGDEDVGCIIEVEYSGSDLFAEEVYTLQSDVIVGEVWVLRPLGTRAFTSGKGGGGR